MGRTMSYYEMPGDRQQALGYDLVACFEYNTVHPELTIERVDRILAVWEGERDGDDWRWVVSLTDGKYAFIQGGCDYTGWD